MIMIIGILETLQYKAKYVEHLTNVFEIRNPKQLAYSKIAQHKIVLTSHQSKH